MANTRKRERVFAIVVAGLFVVTTFGLSFLVIWENTHSSTSTNGSDTSSATAASSTSKSTSANAAGSKLSGFTPVATVNSLQITDLKTGTGQTAEAGDTVSVYYTGAVAATGVIFQSTQNGQPASLSLSSVIEGWSKGIPGMKVGGIRQLLIPADEAYGANPPSGSGIPANAPLVFNVTLVSVSK
jgi:FKBP-type peptidyl-prolyl cis-trans isomerase